jgi:hypothetical protein
MFCLAAMPLLNAIGVAILVVVALLGVVFGVFWIINPPRR